MAPVTLKSVPNFTPVNSSGPANGLKIAAGIKVTGISKKC